MSFPSSLYTSAPTFISLFCAISSSVEYDLPKVERWVRFPYGALVMESSKDRMASLLFLF